MPAKKTVKLMTFIKLGLTPPTQRVMITQEIVTKKSTLPLKK